MSVNKIFQTAVNLLHVTFNWPLICSYMLAAPTSQVSRAATRFTTAFPILGRSLETCCKQFMICGVFHSSGQKERVLEWTVMLSFLNSIDRGNPNQRQQAVVYEKYFTVKQRDFNCTFLPLEAVWSHNTGKVLKCLLPGIFWQTLRWNNITEELEMERRRVDMASERPPWDSLWSLDYEHKQAEVGDTLTLLLHLLSNNKAHYKLPPPPNRSWITHSGCLCCEAFQTAEWFQLCRTQQSHSHWDQGGLQTPGLFARLWRHGVGGVQVWPSCCEQEQRQPGREKWCECCEARGDSSGLRHKPSYTSKL